MNYAKRLRDFALITLPYGLLQFGCALDSAELESLTVSGVTAFVIPFIQQALSNSLDLLI